MSAPMLMVTEVPTVDGALDQAAAEWSGMRAQASSDSVLYRATSAGSLLELTAVSDLAELTKEAEHFDQQFRTLAPFVTGDLRRQVLTFVEAPKPTDEAIPDTRYVQMRHIEVPPAVYTTYRDWRENTIFDVVRRADEVKVFLAYHSLISTEPGVMFVSGFDIDPDAYAAVFSSAEYQDIVAQAGSKYIAGGERGLYTTLYERVAGQ